MANKKNALPKSLQNKFSGLQNELNKTEIKEAFNAHFGFSETANSFSKKVHGEVAVSYLEYHFLEEIIEKYYQFELSRDYEPAIETA